LKAGLTIAAAACALASAHGADTVVASPDGRVAIRIAADGTTYAVTRGGEAVIAASPLGLGLDGVPGRCG